MSDIARAHSQQETCQEGHLSYLPLSLLQKRRQIPLKNSSLSSRTLQNNAGGAPSPATTRWWLGQNKSGHCHEPAGTDVWQSLWNFTSLSSTEGLQKFSKLTYSLLPGGSVFLKVTLKIVPSESNKYLHMDKMVKKKKKTPELCLLQIKILFLDLDTINMCQSKMISICSTKYILKTITLRQRSGYQKKLSKYFSYKWQTLCHSVDQPPKGRLFAVVFIFLAGQMMGPPLACQISKPLLRFTLTIPSERVSPAFFLTLLYLSL